MSTSSAARPVHLSELVRYVADRHGVTAKDILGPRHWPWLMPPRREIARALFEAGWSYRRIGEALRRDRTRAMDYVGALKPRARAA